MTNATNGYIGQAHFFRALSHPVRLQILDVLAQQEACVCHLTAALGKPQPYISQQLATLRDIGLVSDRRDGTLIYYTLADEQIARLLAESKDLLTILLDTGFSFPPIPERKLENCPCPRCQE